MTDALLWIIALAAIGSAGIFLLACVVLAAWDMWRLWRRMRR